MLCVWSARFVVGLVFGLGAVGIDAVGIGGGGVDARGWARRTLA